MPRSRLPLAVRLPLHGARRVLRTTRDVADLGLAALDLVGRAFGDEDPSAPPWREPGPPRPAPGEARGTVSNGAGPPPAWAEDAGPGDTGTIEVEVTGDLVYIDPDPADDDAVDVDGIDVVDHVDADVELVEEVADPGAEDGAGATIRVDPPFAGYESLRAADVIARLPGSDVATLATIELFEQTHRRRRTVLDAIARETRRRG